MSRSRVLVLALLTLLLGGGGEPARAERADYVDRPIASVSFVADGTIPEDDMRAAVNLEVGSPLDLSEVARSIRSLYGSGLFRSIRVDAELDADGAVALVYHLSLHYRITSVSFDGIPDEERSVEQIPSIRVGDVASLDAIDRGAEEMRDQLLRRGYMEAVVDPAVTFRREEHVALVTYFVSAGNRATVRDIRFEGSTEPFSIDELKEMLGKRIGKPFAVVNARRWAERLTDALVREDHRDANVRFADAEYDAETTSVELVYEIDVGPRLVVVLEGTDERGVRKQIPFKKKEPYSDDRLQETLEAIEEWYQERGYFFASARSDEKTEDGVRTLTITVRPGDEYELGDVVYSGSEQMPRDEIDPVVGAGHPNVLQRIVGSVTGRKFGVTLTQLDEDRQAIESLYRTNGFLSAIVDRGRAETREDELLIDIVFEIFEGPRTVVSSVEVSGLLAMDRASLPRLEMRAGDPANPIDMTTDVVAIQAALSAAGFAEARVAHELALNEDSTEATLVYRVDEGARFRYGRTVVRGNTFTDESVIRNKAKKLAEGNPFSFAEMGRVQRDLNQLGIFRKVAINSVQSVNDPLTRDIVVEVDEGQAVRLTGSVGYSTDERARLRGSISHRNLFGKARYLGFDGLYSDVIERYFLTYREPFTFGRDISTQFTIFQDDEVRDDITLDRYGLFVESSKVLQPNVRYSIRYDYKVVTPTCPNLTEEECDRLFFGIQTEEQDDTIASVSQNLFVDGRDDPINPTKGWLSRSSLEYAFPMFQSRSEFVKGFTQLSWYKPARKAVFALSGRLGLIYPISEGDPYNGVPFSERFLAGGENSHRGFRLKKMGILGAFDDTTFTVDPDGATIRPEEVDGEIVYTVQGGNALLLLNAEIRYPVSESVGVTAFLDIGQIWRLISTIDLGELKYAPGLGVYYETPVGPIRFDLAYNIDAQEHEDEWLPFLTIGYSF